MKGTTNSHKLIKTSKQNYGMLKVGEHLDVSEGIVSVDTNSIALKEHQHSATEITSGVLDTARIPNLSATKITEGVLDLARIPTITTEKIGTGAVTDSQIASGIDASKITTGTLPREVIPEGAVEKLVIVQDKTARLALTLADVQNGDTVKQIEPKGEMYFVKDETKLGTEDAFEVYTAGRASAVDWSGVENKVSASATENGLMSSAHFSKVEGIEAGAQVNLLDGVKVNGTALDIGSDKKVNIPIASSADLGLFKVGANLNITSDGTLSAVAEAQEQADWAQTSDTAKSFIKNKPTVSPSVNLCETTTAISDASTDTQLPTAKATYTFVNGKYVAKETGKGLSTNDYTTAEKNKLAGIEESADVNVIEIVKRNGTALEIGADKSVDISVPTALSQLTADPTHRVVTDDEKTAWNGKQDKLNFDTTPTADSANPVTSAGILTALNGKEPAFTKNTAFNKNFGAVADVKMDGTASAGTSSDVARIDHIHPHDTAKEDVANKVTEISSGASDDEYVSAKAIYDTLHGMIISQSGATVDTTGWVEDATVSGYNYHKDITVSGVTASHFAIVTFSENDAISMNYAQENDTGAGYVRIYAVAVPSANISVNIIAYKAV